MAAFPAAQLDPSTAAMAQESKGYIMKLNSFQVPEMGFDLATPPLTNVQFEAKR